MQFTQQRCRLATRVQVCARYPLEWLRVQKRFRFVDIVTAAVGLLLVPAALCAQDAAPPKAEPPVVSHSTKVNHSQSGSRRSNAMENQESTRNPDSMGSPYVPLDSWVYPALERLAALGYAKTAFLGMRPWNRMECARLLDEASDEMEEDGVQDNETARQLVRTLSSEFTDELSRMRGDSNLGLTLESVYTRVTGISGSPVADGYHFGQTIINDYGRPFAEGFNSLVGVTARAVAGPLSFYGRSEYQHAPVFPALSSQARAVIQSVDGLATAPPDIATPARNRVKLVAGYVGVQIRGWQLTFGKQELWWGPDASGPMLFSTNAEPVAMLQITRVHPLRLPSILGRLGPMRVQYLFGRLQGQQWVDTSSLGLTGSWTRALENQPFLTGQKFSFKPTPNLEVGLSATAVFAGPGMPLTFHTLADAMFSSGNAYPGTATDPGDRRGAFDFAYRIPRLRNWLTFYADAYTEDQSNPWFAWDKSAVTAGIYLPRIPKFQRLDFRAEGLFTDLPGGTPVVNRGFFYFNARYRSGYTNNGNLIGSWIGRQGQGAAAWTNLWFSPTDRVQLSFRHQKVSPRFIPEGGSLTDFGLRAEFWLRSQISLSGAVQYERWKFPVLAPAAQVNTTAQFQITFHPQWTLK